jgi:oxalate decarboxylase/phosphoglucose isomerase-like protein (cupin superfamily)
MKYVYKQIFNVKSGTEIEIPEGSIEIHHWIDKATEIDIFPMVSWLEPVGE